MLGGVGRRELGCFRSIPHSILYSNIVPFNDGSRVQKQIRLEYNYIFYTIHHYIFYGCVANLTRQLIRFYQKKKYSVKILIPNTPVVYQVWLLVDKCAIPGLIDFDVFVSTGCNSKKIWRVFCHSSIMRQ